jgi:hypothetical protein
MSTFYQLLSLEFAFRVVRQKSLKLCPTGKPKQNQYVNQIPMGIINVNKLSLKKTKWRIPFLMNYQVMGFVQR